MPQCGPAGQQASSGGGRNDGCMASSVGKRELSVLAETSRRAQCSRMPEPSLSVCDLSRGGEGGNDERRKEATATTRADG